MSRKYLQDLIKNLQEYYKCPSCESHYHFDDIKVLGQIDQYCFVQLGCHACSMPVLATFQVGQTGLPTATDLNRREEARFAERGAISAIEIAEFHRFLTGHQGRLGKLSKK